MSVYPQIEVLFDGKVGDMTVSRIVEKNPDAQGEGVRRVFYLYRLPVDIDVPADGLLQTRQNMRQTGLARARLGHNRVYFAGPQGKADTAAAFWDPDYDVRYF